MNRAYFIVLVFIVVGAAVGFGATTGFLSAPFPSEVVLQSGLADQEQDRPCATGVDGRLYCSRRLHGQDNSEVLRLDSTSASTTSLYSTRTQKFCVDDGQHIVCNSDTPQDFTFRTFGNNTRIALRGNRGWCLDRGVNIDCSAPNAQQAASRFIVKSPSPIPSPAPSPTPPPTPVDVAVTTSPPIVVETPLPEDTAPVPAPSTSLLPPPSPVETQTPEVPATPLPTPVPTPTPVMVDVVTTTFVPESTSTSSSFPGDMDAVDATNVTSSTDEDTFFPSIDTMMSVDMVPLDPTSVLVVAATGFVVVGLGIYVLKKK